MRESFNTMVRFWTGLSMKDEIEREAINRGMSVSALLRLIISQWLKGNRRIVSDGK